MKRSRIELSRRKLLGSLGAVGATSAAAGLGTTAYFNDTETFDGNQLTAGELDLKARWEVQYYGAEEELQQHVSNLSSGTLCGADVVSRPTIDLQDVKPGDAVLIRFDLQSCTNPGFLWMNGGIQSNEENGVTEPESAVNPVADVGELPQSLRSQIFVRPGQDDFAGVEALTGGVDGTSPSATGVTEVFPQEVQLSQALSTLNSGIGLGLQGNVPAGSGGRDCFAGSSTLDTQKGLHQVGMKIVAPETVGNEIQSDTFSLDLGFYGEQCRHNDGTGDPSQQASPTITAQPPTPSASSAHLVRVPVDAYGNLAGNSLHSMTLDYPSGFDLTNANDGSGVIEHDDSTTDPLSPSTSSSQSSITLSYSGQPLQSGDTITAFINNVVNAAAGTYDVDITMENSASTQETETASLQL